MADFYPNTEGEKLSFLDNYVAKIATIGPTVGLTPDDVTEITDSTGSMHTAVADKVAKRTASEASTANCTTVSGATEDLLRSQARRVKAHPNYTRAIGEDLGLEAPQSVDRPPMKGPAASERPDLRAETVLNGEVTISFVKRGHTGVEIRSRRGEETEYTAPIREMISPWVDRRPNLGDGPEMRYYVAQFLEKDDLVGQISDVLVVTVPGKV